MTSVITTIRYGSQLVRWCAAVRRTCGRGALADVAEFVSSSSAERPGWQVVTLFRI